MANILNIETATPNCSVAISIDGKILCAYTSPEKTNHSSILTLAIEKIMKESMLSFNDLDAVSVSIGPGSYTGLRIGLSTAKGICFAMQIPLIGIGTLKILALAIQHSNRYIANKNNCFLALMDARRMEVYAAAYNSDLIEILEPRALILNQNSFSNLIDRYTIIGGGDGMKKINALNFSKNIMPSKVSFPNAIYMSKLAENDYKNKSFNNILSCEPLYLKPVFFNKSNK